MGQSTEELNTEIAGTRQALSSDLDALQDKVSPSAIIERRKAATRSRLLGVKDSVMGSAQSATSSVGDTAHGAVQSAEQTSVQGSPLGRRAGRVRRRPARGRPRPGQRGRVEGQPEAGRHRQGARPADGRPGQVGRPGARRGPQGSRQRRRPGGQGHRPAVGGARPGPGPDRRWSTSGPTSRSDQRDQSRTPGRTARRTARPCSPVQPAERGTSWPVPVASPVPSSKPPSRSSPRRPRPPWPSLAGREEGNLVPGAPAPEEPALEERTDPQGPLPGKPDQAGPAPLTPTGAPLEAEPGRPRPAGRLPHHGPGPAPARHRPLPEGR